MSARTSTDFSFNSWVWVKQHGYPWWPAIVLDPAQVEQELPEGSDVALLCGPSDAATLAFASSKDPQQLRPYNGAIQDAELIKAGRSDENCAAAIEELIASGEGADLVSGEEALHDAPSASTVAAADGHHAATGEDSVDWQALVAETEAAMEESRSTAGERKHKKEKKHKREKRDRSSRSNDYGDSNGGHKKKRNKSSRHSHRHRGGETDLEEGAMDSGSDDDEESGDDEDVFQRRTGAPSSRSATKRTTSQRQSTLEEYDLGSGTLSSYNPRNDPAYLYRKVRSARRSASSTELRTCTQELRDSISQFLNGAVTAIEVEADILATLRRLTNMDVTVAQLQETGVGVAIGSLLRSFTPPVVQLAQAILNYWFHSLPQNIQEQLSTENEVDRCSMETCSDGVAAGNELGRIGINIFGCFTEEEINDAPTSVDVMTLCGTLEDALERHCDADAQMTVLSAFDDTGDVGKALRRLVLAGKIDAQDIVTHRDNISLLVRSRQHRPPKIRVTLSSQKSIEGSGTDSPTSPYDVFSISDDASNSSPAFGSPSGRTTTALYTCPHCGANDAYQSSYSVQAHDNLPDILRCKKCGQTWNMAEQ